MSNHRDPVPKWLNEKYLEVILKSHLSRPKLKVQHISVKPGSKVGDNYVGQIFRINVFYEENNRKDSLSVIGKLTPATKLVEAMGDASDIFQVEATFFSSLLNRLNNANKGKDSARFSPICYHVDFDKKLILLEDLMAENFVMLPKSKSLSLAHAVLVVEKLACFHGASHRVILEDPSLIETYTTNLWDTDLFAKWYENGHNALDVNVESYGFPEEWCRKLRSKRHSWKPGMVAELKEDHLKVILHGDPWMNNMLFHFKNGEVDDVLLLDYQMVWYNSFANDVLYFLFTSVEAQVLVNDLDTILERYYKKLSYIAPDIPGLTLERVKEEFYERLFLGFMMTIMFRPCFLNDNPPDMEKVINGELYDLGFKDVRFISDLKVLLPFFEKAGLL